MYDQLATGRRAAVRLAEKPQTPIHAVPPGRLVVGIARNKSIMLAEPGHATVAIQAAMQAVTVTAAAATWPQTATQSLDRVTPTACRLAGVRTARVRLASVAIDMVWDDGMVAMEPQVAMME